MDFQKLGLTELEAYHLNLKEKGLRPNSRRRKLMTAKTFLRYLSGRMDVSTVGSEKIIPPEKVEKPPKLVARDAVVAIMQSQPQSDIGARNRALIGVLLDTGMLVTEALSLRPQDCTYTQSGAVVQILGKRSRSAYVTKATAEALKALPSESKYFFYGYSRSGPNADKLTARGVEVLFKAWAKAHDLKHLHPRTLRHLFVVDSMLQGKSETDIMQALGLKTPYAFRVYRPLLEQVAIENPELAVKLKSKTETTYTSGTDQKA